MKAGAPPASNCHVLKGSILPSAAQLKLGLLRELDQFQLARLYLCSYPACPDVVALVKCAARREPSRPTHTPPLRCPHTASVSSQT